MTQEILYKLSELLGIKLKIMDYEDQKEDIYLTIIMPFFIDEEIDILDSDIDELPEGTFDKIPYLSEVVGRNILYENRNEKSDIDDIEIKKINENNIKNNKSRWNNECKKMNIQTISYIVNINEIKKKKRKIS